MSGPASNGRRTQVNRRIGEAVKPREGPSPGALRFVEKAATWKFVPSRYYSKVSHDKPGRNELCNCGSGKKYKNCCGR